MLDMEVVREPRAEQGGERERGDGQQQSLHRACTAQSRE
jgi:hypothetical protein